MNFIKKFWYSLIGKSVEESRPIASEIIDYNEIVSRFIVDGILSGEMNLNQTWSDFLIKTNCYQLLECEVESAFDPIRVIDTEEIQELKKKVCKYHPKMTEELRIVLGYE